MGDVLLIRLKKPVVLRIEGFRVGAKVFKTYFHEPDESSRRLFEHGRSTNDRIGYKSCDDASTLYTVRMYIRLYVREYGSVVIQTRQ